MDPTQMNMMLLKQMQNQAMMGNSGMVPVLMNPLTGLISDMNVGGMSDRDNRRGRGRGYNRRYGDNNRYGSDRHTSYPSRGSWKSGNSRQDRYGHHHDDERRDSHRYDLKDRQQHWKSSRSDFVNRNRDFNVEDRRGNRDRHDRHDRRSRSHDRRRDSRSPARYRKHSRDRSEQSFEQRSPRGTSFHREHRDDREEKYFKQEKSPARTFYKPNKPFIPKNVGMKQRQWNTNFRGGFQNKFQGKYFQKRFPTFQNKTWNRNFNYCTVCKKSYFGLRSTHIKTPDHRNLVEKYFSSKKQAADGKEAFPDDIDDLVVMDEIGESDGENDKSTDKDKQNLSKDGAEDKEEDKPSAPTPRRPETSTRSRIMMERERARRKLQAQQKQSSTSTAAKVQKKHMTMDEDPLGLEYIIPVSGYFCKLCCKFYHTEVAAKKSHAGSKSHKEKLVTARDEIKKQEDAAKAERRDAIVPDSPSAKAAEKVSEKQKDKVLDEQKQTEIKIEKAIEEIKEEKMEIKTEIKEEIDPAETTVEVKEETTEDKEPEPSDLVVMDTSMDSENALVIDTSAEDRASGDDEPKKDGDAVPETAEGSVELSEDKEPGTEAASS